MTKGVKAIFQDVDGCLNPVDGEEFGVVPDWRPSDQQVAMLKEINALVERVPLEHFVINTGRPWPLVRSLVEFIPSPKLRYFLLEHACVLYDRVDQTYLDCSRIARDCGLPDLEGRYQRVGLINQLFDWYQQSGRAQLEDYYGADLPALDKVANLSFAIPNEVDGDELLLHIEARVRDELDAADIDQLSFVRSSSYIDILPGVHKLDGVHLLAAYLDIDLDAAVAVGDYLNDLSVFQFFRRVHCPANAHPSIKALAQSKGRWGHVSSHPYGSSLIELLHSIGG